MRYDSSEQGLARLALRWPAHRRRLFLLRNGDEDFVALCAAYDEACDALDAWRRSGSPNAGGRVMEYQELVTEIEVDVMRFLTSKNT